MISEHKLASTYSSFWRVALPFSDAFTRRMNLATQAFAQYYELDVASDRAALVSEMSFRLLGRIFRNAEASLDRAAVDESAQEAWSYIARFPDSGLLPAPTASEIAEAQVLSARLNTFFRDEGAGEPLIVNPSFDGCGLVDNCAGDILAGTTLYEIKNVDRNFRIVDVRQLIVYCALNAEKPKYPINSVGLVNGRSGRFYRIDLDLLALDLAGSSAADLFSEVVTFMSSELASR